MANPMADEMRRFKSSDEKNPFEAMSERFDRAAQLLGLDPDLYAVMRVPSRELKVYIPVRMDSGISKFLKAFACSTTLRAVRRKAEFVTRRM
jgi:glutamate dehydrogenase (NAD(P)+)